MWLLQTAWRSCVACPAGYTIWRDCSSANSDVDGSLLEKLFDRQRASSRKSRARSLRGGHQLVERDTDPLVAAPDRVAAADELIGLDHEHERRRQTDAACEV